MKQLLLLLGSFVFVVFVKQESTAQNIKSIKSLTYKVADAKKELLSEEKLIYSKSGFLIEQQDQTKKVNTRGFDSDRKITFEYPNKDSSLIIETQFVKLEGEKKFSEWRKRKIFVRKTNEKEIIDYQAWEIKKNLSICCEEEEMEFIDDLGNRPILNLSKIPSLKEVEDNEANIEKRIIKLKFDNVSPFVSGEFEYLRDEDGEYLVLENAKLQSNKSNGSMEIVHCTHYDKEFTPERKQLYSKQGLVIQHNFIENNFSTFGSEYEYEFDKYNSWTIQKELQKKDFRGKEINPPKVLQITEREIEYY